MTLFHLLTCPNPANEETWVDVVAGAANNQKYDNILIEMSQEMEARNALERYNDSKDPSTLKGNEGLSIAWKIAEALKASESKDANIFTVGESEDAMKRFLVKLVVTKHVSLRKDNTLLMVSEERAGILDYIKGTLKVKATKI